ncbi:MAG: barstar family protein [Clostridia bacterium]|nr:barstar family protein [Clostridia bacterium]
MNYNNAQKRNAFKQIKGTDIILDFSNCKYLERIHSELKEIFGLPEYYGENWDALWDCLDDRFDDDKNYTIKIYGYGHLEKELQDHCSAMIEVFNDVHKDHPNVEFLMIS